MSPERPYIMVVDDNDLVADVMRLAITSHYRGCEVKIYYDPREALKSARQRRPDLVVLDVNMPGMSGPQLLAELDQDEAKMVIPAIFVTAADDPAQPDFRECLRLVKEGRAKYLSKPFELKKLANLVNSTLNGNTKPDIVSGSIVA